MKNFIRKRYADASCWVGKHDWFLVREALYNERVIRVCLRCNRQEELLFNKGEDTCRWFLMEKDVIK